MLRVPLVTLQALFFGCDNIAFKLKFGLKLCVFLL